MPWDPPVNAVQLLKARVLLREVAGELLSDFRASTAAANGSGLGDTRGGKGAVRGAWLCGEAVGCVGESGCWQTCCEGWRELQGSAGEPVGWGEGGGC